MAVSSYWYLNGIKNLLNTNVNMANVGNFRVALLNGSSYSITNSNLCNNVYWSELSSAEIAGTNYTAAGAGLTLGSSEVDVDNAVANHCAYIGTGVTNTAWTSATFTARYAIIYNYTGTNTTSSLLGVVDFGQNETCSNGSFTIDWNDTAIFKITPAILA